MSFLSLIDILMGKVKMGVPSVQVNLMGEVKDGYFECIIKYKIVKYPFPQNYLKM